MRPRPPTTPGRRGPACRSWRMSGCWLAWWSSPGPTSWPPSDMGRRLGSVLFTLVLAAAGLAMLRPAESAASAERAEPGASAVIGKRVIGHSVAGRPIVAWHLGREQAAPTVVLFSTMHGDEAATRQLLRA